MKIAFYAPLKPPSHPQPSGDRLMARSLLSALRDAGHDVSLASQFRTWDGVGDSERQLRLKDIGNKLGHRLLRRYAQENAAPDLWFTYHVYHKAPDWIGPLVCAALSIPYVLAEASYAPKQTKGPWRIGQEQCRRCIRSAQALISLNDQDLPCLRTVMDPKCMLVDLKPFLLASELEPVRNVRAEVARKWNLPEDVAWLVCVAMMRPGDKLASFARLARALQQQVDQPWHLIIVGDGIARDRVEELIAPIRDRTTMMGLLDRDRVFSVLKACDVYVWPAVNEAYGMALLEAQACGLPVVAAATGGVARIVAHEQTGFLSDDDDEKSFSAYIRQMITHPRMREAMGQNALLKTRREHDYAQAVRVIAQALQRLRT